jgi:hypothetical protein
MKIIQRLRNLIKLSEFQLTKISVVRKNSDPTEIIGMTEEYRLFDSGLEKMLECPPIPKMATIIKRKMSDEEVVDELLKE